MELVVGLLVAIGAVAVILAAKAGAERARREREERWARVPAGTADPIHPASAAVSGPRPGSFETVPAAGSPTPGSGGVVSRAARLAAQTGSAEPRPEVAAVPRRRVLRARVQAGGEVQSAQVAGPAPGAAAGPRRTTARARPPAQPVDVNSATVDELRILPGVGVRAAERIVAHRERYGPFPSLAALEAVEGFDQHRVSRLAQRATVGRG
jgi:competence protein ComEA